MTTRAASVPTSSSETAAGVIAPPASPPVTFDALLDSELVLLATTGLAETLDTVVDLARRGFHADGAALLWVTDGRTAKAMAATDAAASQADAMQVDCHQGPGIHAIQSRQPVISSQLRWDSRWRFWAPQAADLGFCSVLSLVLSVDGDATGALTLYSRQPSTFRTDCLAPGLAFARQASVAISRAVERGRPVDPTHLLTSAYKAVRS